MGQMTVEICNDCGTVYQAMHWGGMRFHLLHCDACGADASVAFDEIDVPNPQAPEAYPAFEAKAGTCRCGGQFRIDAPIRCPKCHSTDHRTDPTGARIMYD